MGDFRYRIELSETFKASLKARMGDDREGIEDLEREAARLTDCILHNVLPSRFEEMLEDDLFDPNATMVVYDKNGQEDGVELPFIQAYYMVREHKKELHDLVVSRFHDIHDFGCLENQRAFNPLFTLFRRGIHMDAWNEITHDTHMDDWDLIAHHPNYDPNAPIQCNFDKFLYIEFPQPLPSDKVDAIFLSQPLNSANILEHLCDKQLNNEESAGSLDTERMRWRNNKIEDLINAGSILTPNTRALIEEAEKQGKMVGPRSMLIRKQLRLEGLLEGSIDFATLGAQDVKDMYAFGITPEFFSRAANDLDCAQALIAACEQAPTWLQERLSTGIALLQKDSQQSWTTRDVVQERTGRAKAGGEA